MDLSALYRAAGVAPPKAEPAPEPTAAPTQPAPRGGIAPGRSFTRDELRRALNPDEWVELQGNNEALRQFAASLRATGDFDLSCSLCAPAWAALEPGPETQPIAELTGPNTCRECSYWTADNLNPPGGMGSCHVPLPERERLRMCPTPWPWQPACRYALPLPLRSNRDEPRC